MGLSSGNGTECSVSRKGGILMQYSIFEGNMERLEKKINRISNKCKEFGCEFTYCQVGEEFKELENDQGNKYTARFVIVEVEGTAIVNGWKFIASIEHTQKGNIINRIGDLEVPEKYYTSESICEHCNTNRSRKDTYIVMNEKTGEFKQVGKSCLNDFTNGLSAEAIAHYISLYDELIQGETPSEGGRGENYYETETILKYVSETIRRFGYVKRQDFEARSTADRAFDYYCVDYGHMGNKYEREILIEEMKSVNFNTESDYIIKNVADALAWIVDQDENNNYIHNLKTVCSLKYVTGRNLGILASLFPAYNRDLEYKAEKAEREQKWAVEKLSKANSQHIGNIGDRITVQIESIKCLTTWETQWGLTGLYEIVDGKGNVYIWKTSSFFDNEFKTIKGTVKEHKEYNGILQTELTRCRVS